MKSIKWTLPLVIIVSLTQCRDTCNRKYERTFSSVTFQSWDTTATGNLRVKLALTTLPKLPNRYFEETFENETPLRAINVMPSKDLISFEIPKDWWSTVFPSNYNARFSFGDRMRYLDCKHPGKKERYDLEFKFNIDTASGAIQLKNLSWEEFHRKGVF